MSRLSRQTFGVRSHDSTIWNPSLPMPTDHTDLHKRRLLLVYIHGFMGSEASFLKFPAHVHDCLDTFLGGSHIIYTRIYPQYKCRGEMKDAIDQFSTWLAPHEADDLDIILLGHSIGGALAAGVTLLPPLGDSAQHTKRHRILGLVNFDVPFLGLHPHVVFSGIRSLFQKKDAMKETIPDELQGLEEMDTSYFPTVTNPNFDPSFENDVRLPARGLLHDVGHFLHKNIHHLPRSIFDSLMSYYKFPGYLNRLPHLRRQYKEMMNLEAAESANSRVRFVNYYTESTGRRKPPAKANKQEVDSYNDDHKSSCTNIPKVGLEDRTRTYIDTPKYQPKSLVSCCSSSSIDTSHSRVESDTRKTRTFVLKPSHHWNDGDDSLWKAIQMEDMDEVGAHQSMFLPGSDVYDRLIGDAVSNIERWVQDDMSARLLQTQEKIP
ncbi:unnamed protein product [Penicillium salamii]|uniref:DUF676 domain-containing protein n=1 Tax=Penicillium salamii TaxID=1612424 RepID=A0A9W4J2Q8_9EURO|nr:unnamed protein product [Penicillium salamii]CAG8189838.1 unnamed protein product [Penicillium salamii]CAG8260954.1 unnamed protein product [Penicillium salamii]CAG8314720.1 unnamed protein product [Penicillium salamii]CAG8370364.1 unnamed protein product [Penicillium salamii]